MTGIGRDPPLDVEVPREKQRYTLAEADQLVTRLEGIKRADAAVQAIERIEEDPDVRVSIGSAGSRTVNDPEMKRRLIMWWRETAQRDVVAAQRNLAAMDVEIDVTSTPHGG